MTSPDRVAWLVSRFPVVTETFILREMDELERRGASIDLFALVRDDPAVLHDSAAARLSGLVAGSDIGLVQLAGAQLRWFRRRPRRLAQAWLSALWGNRRSPSFLLRALAVVPVAAVFAERMEQRGVRRIHAHWATHPALAAYVIGLLTDLPYGVTAHAHDIYVEGSMLGEKLGSADLVVTISEFNRRHLMNRFPEIAGRCALVRCGIPDASVAEQPLPHHRGDRIEIACVGSLKPYKGHRYLIEACRMLVEAGIDVRCSLAGAGQELDRLTALVDRLDLNDNVRFLGAIDSTEVVELLRSTDVFVLPSTVEPSGKTEGIPVALMEAMASGVPVVASDVSGIPELIEDGVSGLLVPEGKPASLAAAIARLVDQPDLARELATAAITRIDEEFTVGLNGARLAAMLDIGPPVPNPSNTSHTSNSATSTAAARPKASAAGRR